jgi:hypothetical protein
VCVCVVVLSHAVMHACVCDSSSSCSASDFYRNINHNYDHKLG